MFELGCEKDENKQKEALTGPYLDANNTFRYL